MPDFLKTITFVAIKYADHKQTRKKKPESFSKREGWPVAQESGAYPVRSTFCCVADKYSFPQKINYKRRLKGESSIFLYFHKNIIQFSLKNWGLFSIFENFGYLNNSKNFVDFYNLNFVFENIENAKTWNRDCVFRRKKGLIHQAGTAPVPWFFWLVVSERKCKPSYAASELRIQFTILRVGISSLNTQKNRRNLFFYNLVLFFFLFRTQESWRSFF